LELECLFHVWSPIARRGGAIFGGYFENYRSIKFALKLCKSTTFSDAVLYKVFFGIQAFQIKALSFHIT
jgi:hypothetical protein